jgi:hypothetical protein
VERVDKARYDNLNSAVKQVLFGRSAGGVHGFHSWGIPHWQRPTDFAFAQDTGVSL